MYTYDITIQGFGLVETYRGIETEMHEEFYVQAIDNFCATLKKKNIPTPEKYFDFLAKIKCSYVKRIKK